MTEQKQATEAERAAALAVELMVEAGGDRAGMDGKITISFSEIGLILTALRRLAAQPAPGGDVRERVETCYRGLAKELHPDAGGSADAMAELNAARDAALKEIG